MAKRHNPKAEKAKRNLEYARQFKKRRPVGRRGGGAPRPPRPEGAPAGTGEGGSFSEAPRRIARPMFDATCSGCGVETKVPFEPTSGKPVYCQTCFQAQRA